MHFEFQTIRTAPDNVIGTVSGEYQGISLGSDVPIRIVPEFGSVAMPDSSDTPAAALSVTIENSDVLKSIDWGTKVVETVIDVYFAPAGTFLDGAEELGLSQGYSDFQKRQFFSALNQFEKVTNLTFQETSSQLDAEFRLGTIDLDSYDAIAFMIPPGSEYAGLEVFDPDYLQWLDEDSGAPLLSRGGFIYAILLEEFGHGLGLAHPHDDGGTSTILEGVVAAQGSYGVGDLNQGIYTTMGYNEGWPAGPYGGEYYDGYYTYVNDFGYQAGPMALDIAVLQEKYGANLTWASGDDNYNLPKYNGYGTFYECIWDAGGTDAIHAGDTGNAIIDLRPATLQAEFGGGGYVSYTSGVRGGFTIAAGVTIENAFGNIGDDRLIGNTAANTILGAEGGDWIWGGKGNDTLFGNDGRDVLQGDYLDDIFDPASAQIVRVYKATLARWPDAAGHLGWTEQLLEGTPLVQIISGFTQSTEFQNLYGDTTDEDFVTLLYENVLDRAPDPDGLTYWLNLLEGGSSREQVVFGFSESAEFKVTTVAGTLPFSKAGYKAGWSDDVFRLYQAALDRRPDVGGFDGWTKALADGEAFLDVVTGFVASREFQIVYGDLDDVEFVTLLYNNVLDREPDETGLAGWISLLAGGMSREQVLQGFSQSIEFQRSTAPLLEAWMESLMLADQLDGGSGDDVLFGGIFADSFRFSFEDGGYDIVSDFEIWDTLILENFGFETAAEAAAAFVQDGADAVLDFDGGQIKLLGVQLDDLGADEFVLV